MTASRLLLLLTVLTPLSAQAFYCHEPSPTYLRLGQSYFDDREPKIAVRGDEPGLRVLDDLKGEWEGYLTELSCEGTRDQPEPIQRYAEVEAEIRDSNTALLLISMSKEYDSSYISDGDRVFLMNKGSMTSLRISKQGASAEEQERRNSGGYRGGSRYVEVFSDVVIHNEDEISIEWQLFSNGYFVYRQRLELERDL